MKWIRMLDGGYRNLQHVARIAPNPGMKVLELVDAHDNWLGQASINDYPDIEDLVGEIIPAAPGHWVRVINVNPVGSEPQLDAWESWPVSEVRYPVVGWQLRAADVEFLPCKPIFAWMASDQYDAFLELPDGIFAHVNGTMEGTLEQCRYGLRRKLREAFEPRE